MTNETFTVAEVAERTRRHTGKFHSQLRPPDGHGRKTPDYDDHRAIAST